MVSWGKTWPAGEGVKASKSDMAARVEKMGVSRRVVGGAREVMEKRIPLLQVDQMATHVIIGE